MSPFGLYPNCRIFLSDTVFSEGKPEFVSIWTFHYGIPIFDFLIRKTIVFACRSNLSTVSFLYNYGCDIDRMWLEFLYGRDGE